MPFQSEKQRRYLWANEPEIARDWTDTYGSGIAKALGGRIGFFKGAQADTASGKSMSPGTSAGHTPGAGHRDSGGWSPGVGGTPYVPSPKKEGILNTKNIKRAQKGLDAHALWNIIKTGSLKVNPLAWAANYGLSNLAKQKGKSGLQTNFVEDEDEMTIEELRDYFQGIGREELGIPEPGSVDWEDYMGGKVARGPQPFLPGLEPINTMNNPTWNTNTQEFEYNMQDTSKVGADISNLLAAEQLTLPGMQNMPSGYPWSVAGEGASPQSWIRPTAAEGGRMGYNPGGLATLWPR